MHARPVGAEISPLAHHTPHLLFLVREIFTDESIVAGELRHPLLSNRGFLTFSSVDAIDAVVIDQARHQAVIRTAQAADLNAAKSGGSSSNYRSTR